MRHIPSEKTLKDHLTGVLEKARNIPGQVSGTDAVNHNLKQIRRLLVQWRDHEIKSSVMLRAINEILDGHGIEHLASRNHKAVAYYVNMGDTYTPTILLDIRKDRVNASDWGTWVEIEERQGNKFD